MQGPLSKLMAATKAGAEDIDREALAQAHIMAISGACLALGIRYAGSANAAAYGVLKHYLLYLLAAKKTAPDASQGDQSFTFHASGCLMTDHNALDRLDR